MKYSKSQILNSIKYWKNKLIQLNEAKSKLLSIFEKEFGKNILFSRTPILKITDDNIYIKYLKY